MFEKSIRGFRIEEGVLVFDFCDCRIHQFEGKYKVFLTRIEGIEEITSMRTFDTLKEAVDFVRKITISNFFGYN